MPWLPSRTHSCLGSGVVAELTEDRVADLPLECASGFLRRLPLLDLAEVVGAAGVLAADLGDRGHVQGVVELAVASRVQPVSHDFPEDASIGAVAL